MNSNFHQLLMLRSEDGKSILDYLNRKADIYTSPTIQNEMLEVNMPIRFSADRLSSFSFKHKLKLRFIVSESFKCSSAYPSCFYVKRM